MDTDEAVKTIAHKLGESEPEPLMQLQKDKLKWKRPYAEDVAKRMKFKVYPIVQTIFGVE